MSSFLARVAAVLLLAMGLSFLASPAHAAEGVTVVVVDADRWQRFAEQHGAIVGLGVFPDSRDPLRFIEEIGTGAPTSRPGARSVVSGAPGTLGAALARAGVDVATMTGDRQWEAALSEAFSGATLVSEEAGSRSDSLVAPTVVIGIGAKTPVWVAICREASCMGARTLATGSITRRPGILTPYDVAATILDMFDIERSERFIGNSLTSEDDPQALDRIRRMRTHLERGAGLGATRGATTTLLAIGALFVGLLLRWRGKGRLAARTGQAAGVAVAGYLVALFVPSGDGTILAVVITAVVVAGASLRFRDPVRSTGRLMLGAAAIFAILVLVAPLRPGGLPGAAIWGNPLTSWRFTGVQNFEVSFIAVCVVVWAVLAGLNAKALAVVALAATVIVGAPTVGSNFVGVLTLAFGAALALLAMVRKRVELWQAATAALIASAAFALSLVADAASPVSHGGRAARRISEGGFSTLVDFVEARIRLNLDLMGSFEAGTGYVLMVMMLVVVALLVRWSVKPGAPRTGRTAVWAGTAMALSSLVLEDSGFYSGAIMLVAAAAAWMVVTATDEDGELSSSDPALAGGG